MKICKHLVWFCMAASVGTAFAGKPEWAGKGNKHQQAEQTDQAEYPHGPEIQVGAYFGERQRSEVAAYYQTQSRAGKCPPGLAKKHNGCQAPGQAKKWQLGRPLERDVVFYPVPDAVVVRIGRPPAGYRYVRVLNDILVVAIATQIVVDAIEDLMR